MAFLRSVTAADAGPVLERDDMVLRAPVAGDYAGWAELRARSRDHLTPWEPAWTRDELSKAAFRRRLKHYYRDIREEVGYAFFIFAGPGSELVGGLTLSNVRRGVTQSVSVGYWIGVDYTGRGLMTKALHTVQPFVFETLDLHRLEAACLPSNGASIRVLEKAGFQREGIAREYLKIDGAWRDHLLYALLKRDWRGHNSAIVSG